MDFAKVRDMLFQQMKCNDYLLEDGNLYLLLSPSNLVANYNHDCTNNISNEHSTVIELLITDTNSFLPAVTLVLVVQPDNEFESLMPAVRLVVQSNNDLNLNERLKIGVDASLNLLHVLQLDLGSVVLPYLTSFGTPTRISTGSSHQIPQQ